jgi:hypothetical protein
MKDGLVWNQAQLREFCVVCSLWLESLEEHLPTGIAGVLRLRSGQALRLRAIRSVMR